MNKKEYEFEIAFSFTVQDEDLALTLYGLLNDRLKCFVYTQEQKQLAGTNGEETFNRIFGKQSRLVVVLHRREWGNTKWTRIEETAIRNRGFDNGYDFVLIVPLDESPAPNWLPKNRLWIGLERWGVESAASVIEARAQELGGSPKTFTIADKIGSIESELEKKKNIDAFLKSSAGYQASLVEFDRLINEIDKITDEIKQKSPKWHLKRTENKQRGIDLKSYKHQLSIQYYPQSFEPYLFIALFRGYFNDDGYADPFDRPTTLDSIRYKFAIDKFDRKGWSNLENDKDFTSTCELAKKWIEDFMEKAIEEKKKNGS